jgi:hypothetical protein
MPDSWRFSNVVVSSSGRAVNKRIVWASANLQFDPLVLETHNHTNSLFVWLMAGADLF